MKLWHGSLTVVVIIIIGLTAYLIFSEKNELVIDAINTNTLPEKFRIAKNLRVMGSAQFSQKQLTEVVKQFKEPIMIVDLREEPHVFIDGIAVSWMKQDGDGFIPSELALDTQRSLMNKAERMGITSAFIVKLDHRGRFMNKAEVPLPITYTYSERQIVEGMKLVYTHFPIPFASVPSNKTVDDFIHFSKAVPLNTWVYFHCRDGINRTNVVMSMYDMLLNAKHIDFQTILHRNYTQSNTGNNINALNSEEIAFLKAFYAYARSNDDNFQSSWTQWQKSHSKVIS